MAPLKRGPKGPMNGWGQMYATTQANYREREEKKQKDRLKYLKKKEKRKGSLSPEEKEEISMLERDLGKACAKCGKK